MVAILSNRSLTVEVLLTTTCLVEQTLNARPITSASDDPEDLKALTPNLFILGRANVCIPFIQNEAICANNRKMFRSSDAYADMIWKQWVKEYLPQKNVRFQWNKSETNLQTGDLVFVDRRQCKTVSLKDGTRLGNLPWKKWFCEFIIDVDGTLKRPVVKQAPLFEKRFQAENGPALLAPQTMFRKSEGKIGHFS